MAVSIEESKDTDVITVEEPMGSLQAHEQRILKRQGKKSLEQALQSNLTLKKDKPS